MVPEGVGKTAGFDQWENLEIFQKVLRSCLDLHRNGSTPVKMTEESLYNLTAGEGDYLEITVTKVAPTSPTLVNTTTLTESTATTTTKTTKNSNDNTHMSIIPDKAYDVKDPCHDPDELFISIEEEDDEQADDYDDSTTVIDSPHSTTKRPYNNTRCGNCGRTGHTVRDCVGPVDEDGDVDACPKCNTAGRHMYDDCPDRRLDEDFDFIYRFRQRKPPIKSHMTWTSFLGMGDGDGVMMMGRESRHQSGVVMNGSWPSFIPWSSRLALEQQLLALRARRPAEWVYYEYDRLGFPDAEAHFRAIDPESEFMAL